VTVRVVLADDQELVRTGLRVLLERDGDITVVAEASDGAGAVRATREHVPDVVLMDLRMPGMDGVAATRSILGGTARTASRVVVLTTYELDDLVVDSMRAGASGFLGKNTSPAALRDAVRVVSGGGVLLSGPAARALVDRCRDRPAPDAGTRLDVLTDRERQVVAEVGRGRGNEEIAHRLRMRPATAKTHVNRAMAKLGARDRAQLVVLAYETGLVVPGHADQPPPGRT